MENINKLFPTKHNILKNVSDLETIHIIATDYIRKMFNDFIKLGHLGHHNGKSFMIDTYKCIVWLNDLDTIIFTISSDDRIVYNELILSGFITDELLSNIAENLAYVVMFGMVKGEFVMKSNESNPHKTFTDFGYDKFQLAELFRDMIIKHFAIEHHTTFNIADYKCSVSRCGNNFRLKIDDITVYDIDVHDMAKDSLRTDILAITFKVVCKAYIKYGKQN